MVKALDWLLDQGASPDATSDLFQFVTPIHVAAALGQLSVCMALQNRGANLNAKDSRGWNAADYAVWSVQEAVTTLLVIAGVIPNKLEPETTWSPPAFKRFESRLENYAMIADG